jgi:uncharacterized protein (DUF111 family)
MRLLYLDCIGGIAGDMTLAALIEAGAPEAELLDALRTLPISGWQWRSERVEIEAIFARRVYITHNEDQPHRHLSDVLEIIEQGDFSARVKQQASAVFTRLAEAEAAVHGTTPDRVHFHEVGAVDAILDVVGACWGLERLGVERVVCSPLPMGARVRAGGARVVAVARACGGGVAARRADLRHPDSGRDGHPHRRGVGGCPKRAVRRAAPDALGARRLRRRACQPTLAEPAARLCGRVGGRDADARRRLESIVQIETHLDDATPQQLGYMMGACAGAGRARCVFSRPCR